MLSQSSCTGDAASQNTVPHPHRDLASAQAVSQSRLATWMSLNTAMRTGDLHGDRDRDILCGFAAA